jgi:hypothetical protein
MARERDSPIDAPARMAYCYAGLGRTMADRIEREINEILEKLEGLPDDPAPPERRPISIAERRERRPEPPPPPTRRLPSVPLNPTHALVAGAGTVVGGLILSNLWAPLIWAAFAGVAVFIGGFVAAFFRRPRPRAEQRDGVFWRDRYIRYDATQSAPWTTRLRRRFRR